MRLAGSIRRRLLATVSLAAILASSPALAERVEAPSGYWMSAEGSYLFADGTAQPLLRAGTGTPAQSDRVRDARAVEIAGGGPLGEVLPGWDFRLAYTGIRAESHQLSATGKAGGEVSLPDGGIVSFSKPPVFTSEIRQGFDIGDFDIGHDVGLGPVDARAFAGLRVVSFNQSARASLLGGEGATELSCSHYMGGGPRVGADGTYPLGEVSGMKIGLTGELAGSALLGRTYHKATVTSSGVESPATYDEEGAGAHRENALNADASLGLTVAVPIGNNECSVTAGYRGQAWFGVVDTQVQGFTLAGSGGSRSGDQFFHGPFLTVAFKW